MANLTNKSFASSDEARALLKSEDFVGGFQEWLATWLQGLVRDNPEKARAAIEQGRSGMSILVDLLRKVYPMLEILLPDAFAEKYKKRFREEKVPINHYEAVRLALGLMAFRLPYTGRYREPGGDVSTIRDYEMLAAEALRDDTLETLIAESYSSPLAFRGLQCALAHLRETGKTIPKALHEWALEVADGTRACPKAGPGRSPYTNQVRDRSIVRALRILVDCGLTMTRNEASEPRSACDAVSGALEAHGIELSYDAVVKVWAKSRPVLAMTGAGSARTDN